MLDSWSSKSPRVYSYTVSWTAVTHATTYQLQERLGTGGWSTIHDVAGTSRAVSGKATGSWGYQVRACNAAGCSGWSSPPHPQELVEHGTPVDPGDRR